MCRIMSTVMWRSSVGMLNSSHLDIFVSPAYLLPIWPDYYHYKPIRSRGRAHPRPYFRLLTWYYVCSMLQGLVDFDGYYLESDPCLVCNNPEVPYAVSVAVFLLFQVTMNYTSISIVLSYFTVTRHLSSILRSLQSPRQYLLDSSRFHLHGYV